MARTFIRQDAQVGSTLSTVGGYIDNTPPASSMESASNTLADDLNNIRSMLSYLSDLQGGNWYDELVAPTALDTGAARGVQQIQDDLHAVERKRVLVHVTHLADVEVGEGDNFVVLGLSELPSEDTAAIGAVTTRGTVAATHGGTFGTHSLAEVAGGTAIAPKNLCEIVDGASRDQILSGGRVVYGLFQTESSTDGSTMTGTTPNRAQLSFVRINSAGDDLEAVPFSDIEGRTVNYSSVQRKALLDLNEQDFLRGAAVDLPALSTVTRQVAYDNQGTTPVDITSNATLDLEGAGLVWAIRDDLEAILLRVIEGSAGGTSEVEISADVDLFDVRSVGNTFQAGATLRAGGTRPIRVGTSDGVIDTSAGDLEVRAAGELFLDDVNQTGSTWSQTSGIKLSDTTEEWDLFEVNFGEVSLLNAVNQAYAAGGTRVKVQATLTEDVAAEEDVNGPGTPHENVDVDLPPHDHVDFVSDVEVYLNGELLRNNTDENAGDVYPGGDPDDGDLRFTFALLGTGSKPDRLTVIVNG